MAVPQLTPEQRAKALAKAAEAREERGNMMANLKAGVITLAELFRQADEDPKGIAARSRVRQVVKNLPGVGSVRAEALLTEAKISDTRRVKGLGSNQRQMLLDLSGKHLS